MSRCLIAVTSAPEFYELTPEWGRYGLCIRGPERACRVMGSCGMCGQTFVGIAHECGFAEKPTDPELADRAMTDLRANEDRGVCRNFHASVDYP